MSDTLAEDLEEETGESDVVLYVDEAHPERQENVLQIYHEDPTNHDAVETEWNEEEKAGIDSRKELTIRLTIESTE